MMTSCSSRIWKPLRCPIVWKWNRPSEKNLLTLYSFISISLYAITSFQLLLSRTTRKEKTKERVRSNLSAVLHIRFWHTGTNQHRMSLFSSSTQSLFWTLSNVLICTHLTLSEIRLSRIFFTFAYVYSANEHTTTDGQRGDAEVRYSTNGRLLGRRAYLLLFTIMHYSTQSDVWRIALSKLMREHLFMTGIAENRPSFCLYCFIECMIWSKCN